MDIFISYATADKAVAEAACAALEAKGIRCWIAPRDVVPGMDYAEAILQAIEDARGMLLIFSSKANQSNQVKRELERAVHFGLPIIPLRIEQVPPNRSLAYFISTPHWLDALTPPLQPHLEELAATIPLLLNRTASPDSRRSSEVPPASQSAPSLPIGRIDPANQPTRTPADTQFPNVSSGISPAATVLARTKSRPRLTGPVILAGSFLLLLLIGFSALFVYFLVTYVLPRPMPTPGTPVAKAVSSNRVVLTWDNAFPNLTTKVERSSGSGSAFREILQVQAGSNTAADESVSGNTAYRYRIRFTSDARSSQYSPEVAVTTLPAPPTSFSAETKSASEIALRWSADDPKPDSIKIERKGASDSNFNLLATVAGTATSHVDSNVSPGTEYQYRLVAVNPSGDSIPSALVSVVTPKSTTGVPPAETTYLFRLHGSNTIGAELAPAWVEAFLRKQGATNINRKPKDKDHLVIEALLPGQSSPQFVEIVALGSGTAFKDLASGSCDIGMASRPIKDDEQQILLGKGMGDMRSRNCENVVGLDGIAMIVNSANPLESLTIDQLKQIFSGAVSDWSQVGGGSGPIKIYLREEESGTRDLVKTLVLKTSNFAPSAEIPGTGSNDDVSGSVAKDLGGIGFVGLPYVRDNKALKIAEGNASPVRPSVFTVHTEDYPLARRLFLYAPANLANDWAKKFLQYALSSEGQNIVNENKFVGLNIDTKSAATEDLVKKDVPPAYTQMTNGATSLGISIRFVPNSSTLDNRAFLDVKRILEFMQKTENRNGKLILIGFADATGSPKANIALSKTRAKAVEKALQEEGLPVDQNTGFGQAVPVGSNDTPEGREKNRRVEIWMKK
jgi:phosphate transport system substrate-binding protein